MNWPRKKVTAFGISRGKKNMFFDRVDAGQKLSEKLREYRQTNPVVLAIPRGGVVVASEVARTLDCTLDLVIPRKIGAPNNPELAIGAVAREGSVIVNEELVRSLNVSQDYLAAETRKQVEEVKRRRRKYLGSHPMPDLGGRTVILVDDGLATGYTALAAVKAVKEEGPRRIVLAVPVAPTEAVRRLKTEVDALVCLKIPEFFFAVGQFYTNFSQTTDEEVVRILAEYHYTG